mmetsp:Transcript_9435/g.21995  ORF Transcript_9435/g.21995 Transcript_9435/m.21995 type:complete len:298 (-) Transcript_9435:278-1171(-)
MAQRTAPSLPRRCCHCAVCRACDALCDELILRWLPTIGVRLPDPLPTTARTQVRSLRFPLLLFLMSFLTASILQIWCLVEGWYLLLRGLPDACEEVRQWLLMYCLALSMTPLMYFLAFPMVLYYGILGGPMIVEKSGPCWKADPDLRTFMLDIRIRSLWTALSATLLLVALCLLRVKVRRLRMWDSSAPTHESVIDSIVQAEPVVVEPGSECAICLETDDGVWKALPCNHAFHQDCLIRWLRCGRRCPLCRLDLHETLLETQGQPAVVQDASPHADQANVQLGQLGEDAADRASAPV